MMARMRDVGYVWEGQPAYRDFPPSIYGLGEGCAYFGLRKAYYLYHGNNATALAKLAHLEEVLCDIFKLDEGVARCRELFPGKPIVLGCYLSDYTLKASVPIGRLRYQWERIPGYLDKGLIDGFCILGAYLIDHHPEQAAWVQDFIAGN